MSLRWWIGTCLVLVKARAKPLNEPLRLQPVVARRDSTGEVSDELQICPAWRLVGRVFRSPAFLPYSGPVGQVPARRSMFQLACYGVDVLVGTSPLNALTLQGTA